MQVASYAVTRRTKKDKGTSILRAHLAANVIALRDTHERLRSLPTVTARNQELARLADVSRSQIQRVTKGTLGASIDVVEAIANALDVRPQDLLTPYFKAQPATEREIGEARELHRRQSR